MSIYIGLDHVQLTAPKGSEGKARAFFSGILGLEELEKPAELKKRGGVWFRCGKDEIHIGIEENFSPSKKAHPAISVSNLKALKEKLKLHNMEIIEDNDTIPGVKRLYISDPFGNRLEFIEKPS